MRLQSLLPVLSRSSHPLRYSALDDIVIHFIYAIDLLSRLLTVFVALLVGRLLDLLELISKCLVFAAEFIIFMLIIA
jgi:hypothetical protein